ncbi:tryptophan synthase beta subunit-like PLP-dependent enzyme [Saccharata proteae CBS 121410]|uniref:Tryptophan synthase beta subunit-like PLP-dependent enzyme n=1 Tax=Saccharata proteae CBS 121410 TaxID=1314787 RepID=A0A9P4HZB6_9PEZI|nr:tryptophan synthase beta subunit-like PLP-dependent enzyme [Saccharata proteae CBS 121410]
MHTRNPLNVYRGPDSVLQYYDPDLQPPLPLVELPASLNPYRHHGVRIYAKMMTMLPAHNVKALPAKNLLSRTVVPDKTDKVVEYSSGSTVISMSIIARACHGITDTRAYLSNKTSEAKLRLMQFFGLNLTLFGGPSQPEPLDERGGIQAARRHASNSETIVNPNQYENEANWNSHFRWTGPQILKQLPEINVLCAGMGTSGTMTGLGTFFNEAKPSVIKVGVCTAAGDRVPGPRSLALMSPVTFPWREAIDALEEVGSKESYALSMAMSREGIICGPSSGFNLQGLYQFINGKLSTGSLDEIKGADGEIHCTFLCCDLPYQYMDEYFQKLDESHFHPITNRRLTAVDLYRYDEAWELDVEVALKNFYNTCPFTLGPQIGDLIYPNVDTSTLPTPKPHTVILDLRRASDFDSWHLPHSFNIPMESVTADALSPFAESATLEQQWLELEAFFKAQVDRCIIPGISTLVGQRVLLVCYRGDTARVATSVLRAKGIEAESLRGGTIGLSKRMLTGELFEKNVAHEGRALHHAWDAREDRTVENMGSAIGSVV